MMHQNVYAQQYQPAMVQQQQQPQQMQQMHQYQYDQENYVSASKKAKMTYNQAAYAPVQSVSVQRRNARERNRVKQVNNGFTSLREHIPSEVVSSLTEGRGASKKLSKVDTLRYAVEYIRRLQGLLDDSDAETSSSISSSESTSSYYSQSPVQCTSVQPASVCSESLASPTPSYISDNSSVENASYVMPSTYPQQTYNQYSSYNQEDDLLDAISWWQQQ